MTTFAVQYLGSRPKDATPQEVRARLREACERLPITMVLLDWDLPPATEVAVAEETSRQHAKLYRWQTWLTGDSQTDLPPEWATVGLDGNPIPGHDNSPDFTFVCPNHSGVEDFLSERLAAIAARGLFQGIFLDRIRFPSPAADPSTHLGCFCRHCVRLAADAGLDLELVHRYVRSLSAKSFVRGLLGKPEMPGSPLEAFLDFREKSITRTVQAVRKQANQLGLSIGLDCFSPALTRMVGQNLTDLDKTCDWIKLMIYPRVFGPAGISFELLGLTNLLIKHGLSESDALTCVREASELPIPVTKAELGKAGLGSATLAQEIQRGREKGITDLLAGVALVEMKGVHESTPEQILADLRASRAADGLVLSWDLWQIPLEHLDTIRNLWEKQ